MPRAMLICLDINTRVGSEAVVASLWLGIISKRYSVDVVTDVKNRDNLKSIMSDTVNAHYVDIDGPLTRTLWKHKAYPLLSMLFYNSASHVVKELVEKNSYNLIHCITPAGSYAYNNYYKFNIPLLIGPLGGGLKIPRNFESLLKGQFVKSILRGLFYKSLLWNKSRSKYFKAANSIIIGGKHILDFLPRSVHPKTKFVFDTLVDTSFFTQKTNNHSTEIRVCYTGRIEPIKGVELLIDAMCNILKRRKDITLTLAGHGILLDSLSAKVISMGVSDSIKFVGVLSKEDVRNLLHESDIYCLPTLRDHGGTAILEAMSCGLPVISSNYGGPSHSVTNDCGILITPRTIPIYVKELEQAIEHLADNKTLRQEMGESARRRVLTNFCPTSLEKTVLEIYSEVSKS